jgi:hypothetical protein
MLLCEYEITRPFAPFLAPVLRWVVQAYLVLIHYAFVLWNLTKKREIVPRIDEKDPLDSLLLLPAVDAARKIWKKEVRESFERGSSTQIFSDNLKPSSRSQYSPR